MISKYNVGLKTLLSEGLSEPEFYGDLVYKFKKLIGIYGDLVYKFKKLIGINDFSFQFRKIITRYRRIGYNLNVMRQSACLVFNPIMVDNYAAFFNCTLVDRASDSMCNSIDKIVVFQLFKYWVSTRVLGRVLSTNVLDRVYTML